MFLVLSAIYFTYKVLKLPSDAQTLFEAPFHCRVLQGYLQTQKKKKKEVHFFVLFFLKYISLSFYFEDALYHRTIMTTVNTSPLDRSGSEEEWGIRESFLVIFCNHKCINLILLSVF